MKAILIIITISLLTISCNENTIVDRDPKLKELATEFDGEYYKGFAFITVSPNNELTVFLSKTENADLFEKAIVLAKEEEFYDYPNNNLGIVELAYLKDCAVIYIEKQDKFIYLGVLNENAENIYKRLISKKYNFYYTFNGFGLSCINDKWYEDISNDKKYQSIFDVLPQYSVKYKNTKTIGCTSGGVGSTSCSVSNGNGSCSVSCGTGYYSCCNDTHTVCKCVKNPPGDSNPGD